MAVELGEGGGGGGNHGRLGAGDGRDPRRGDGDGGRRPRLPARRHDSAAVPGLIRGSRPSWGGVDLGVNADGVMPEVVAGEYDLRQGQADDRGQPVGAIGLVRIGRRPIRAEARRPLVGLSSSIARAMARAGGALPEYAHLQGGP